MRISVAMLASTACVPLFAQAPNSSVGPPVREYRPGLVAFVPEVSSGQTASLMSQKGEYVRASKSAVETPLRGVFFAANRPVVFELVPKVSGSTLAERFETALKDLYKAFDRDGDGTLNAHETELIFSRSQFDQMLDGGYGMRNGSGSLASIELLDRDGTRTVNYEEFAEYYLADSNKTLKTRAALPGNANNQVALTTALFDRLDKDKSKRLSKEELNRAEPILVALDADEDETVSPAEVTAGLIAPRELGGQVGGGMMGMDGMGGRGLGEPVQTDLQVHTGTLPGNVVQQAIAKYDRNGDYEFAANEVDFGEATFKKLDASGDGKLDAKELEVWRTGEADLVVTLASGKSIDDCKCEIAFGKGCRHSLVLPDAKSKDRLVARIGKQTMDFAALPLPNPSQLAANPYVGNFPANKKEVTEKDLAGPQFQALRILFDVADFDGNGKLTKKEFDRFFALQGSIMRLGLTVSHITRVPSLFQLIDANTDGRLSVKELRMAYDRLQPLEPSGAAEVSKGILQPSATVRLGFTLSAGLDSNAVAPPVQPGGYAAEKYAELGPIWFGRMDRNSDGELSLLEFPGSRADFAKVDADGDGVITLAEAEAYDRSARAKR